MKEADQARAYILQFAMKIFLAADNEDRSGQASKYCFPTRSAFMVPVGKRGGCSWCLRSSWRWPGCWGSYQRRLKSA